jgi:hypothetical protein
MIESNALKFKILDKRPLAFLTTAGASAGIGSRVEIQSPTVYVMGMPTETGKTESVDILFTDGSKKIEFNLGIESARVLGDALAMLLAKSHPAHDEEDYEPPLID